MWFEIYFCISVFVTLAPAASSLKSLNQEINYKKKNEPTKYSREKRSDPRNTHKKKFRTHEYPRENFGPIKYSGEKISDPLNTHEKKNLDPRNTYEKEFWTHEIPTKARWHNGTKPT